MSNTERPAAACRILVVEDEPAINDIVATALRYQGHKVTQLGVTVAELQAALPPPPGR